MSHPRFSARAARVLSLLLAAAVIVATAGWALHRADRGADRPTAVARAFLDRYETSDGRIVRRDQGGDTVSEGQAYGMLLAVVAGDRRRFDLAWAWTAGHLRRPDGLLAWHWDQGHVVDSMAAADGDLDTAWALALAADRFGRPADRTQAVALAQAIVGAETSGGLLVGGPWATTAPVTLSPGYDAPEAFAVLARATGDGRWNAVDRGARNAIEQLTRSGGQLPPDWGVRDSSGRLQPTPSPDHATPVQYGLGATRAVIWLAGSCDPTDRQSAARAGTRLRATPAAVARRLDGTPLDRRANPASLAAAALGSSVTDRTQGAAWLRQAAALAQRRPTYYGDAVVALATALFDRPGVLGACPTR